MYIFHVTTSRFICQMLAFSIPNLEFIYYIILYEIILIIFESYKFLLNIFLGFMSPAAKPVHLVKTDKEFSKHRPSGLLLV